MPVEPKVLVVGTTSDYIHTLRRSLPGRALFLTDETIRHRAVEPCPLPDEEVVANLEDVPGVRAALRHHLSATGTVPDGVACFDDESMELAARLASDYHMPYPSVKAVRQCRDKFRTKICWQRAGVPCPSTVRVWECDEAVEFVRRLGRPAVIKPSVGAGSELVYRVADAAQTERVFHRVQRELAHRHQRALFRPVDGETSPLVIEELVEGEEYSCDFAIDGTDLRLLRTARKIFLPGGPLGTALAYVAPADPPLPIQPRELEALLRSAAEALDVRSAICMVDLRFRDGEPVLLELAPRPGGDCIPPLVRYAYGIDMLEATLDFACDRLDLHRPPPAATPHVGLRLFASGAGVIRRLETDAIARDPRVREVHLIRAPGQEVRLPPADYDSWLLGHVIFAPDATASVEHQCLALRDVLGFEMEGDDG